MGVKDAKLFDKDKARKINKWSKIALIISGLFLFYFGAYKVIQSRFPEPSNHYFIYSTRPWLDKTCYVVFAPAMLAENTWRKICGLESLKHDK